MSSQTAGIPRREPVPAAGKTLGMDAFMLHWNQTTTTCKKNELWANCFMREAGIGGSDDIGCAQVGPNTCPEPKRNVLDSAKPAEVFYGAYSIWCKLCRKIQNPLTIYGKLMSFSALQQYMTTIYEGIASDNGSALIHNTYELFRPPVTGSFIFREVLQKYSDDARNKALTLVLSQTIPGKTVNITDKAQADKAVQLVLSVVLEHIMTDFLSGAYLLMATAGKLL